MLQKWGSRKLYDVQMINFDQGQVEETAIQQMISLIHQYKRGLEQEALIRRP
jgi:hypothetical protein